MIICRARRRSDSVVTMEDIADEVGCSVNTVSRAINNKPDVNPVTRMRVLEAAKR